MSPTLRALVVASLLSVALTHATAAQQPTAAPAPAQQAQPAAPPADAAAMVPLPPIKALATADGEKFVAEYDITLPDGRILPFKIFAEEGSLMGQAENQNKVPLLYFGDNTFGAEFDHTVRLSFLVENGKVVSGKLLQRGATMNVIRRP
jgi:hypothetical protein